MALIERLCTISALSPVDGPQGLVPRRDLEAESLTMADEIVPLLSNCHLNISEVRTIVLDALKMTAEGNDPSTAWQPEHYRDKDIGIPNWYFYNCVELKRNKRSQLVIRRVHTYGEIAWHTELSGSLSNEGEMKDVYIGDKSGLGDGDRFWCFERPFRSAQYWINRREPEVPFEEDFFRVMNVARGHYDPGPFINSAQERIDGEEHKAKCGEEAEEEAEEEEENDNESEERDDDQDEDEDATMDEGQGEGHGEDATMDIGGNPVGNDNNSDTDPLPDESAHPCLPKLIDYGGLERTYGDGLFVGQQDYLRAIRAGSAHTAAAIDAGKRGAELFPAFQEDFQAWVAVRADIWPAPPEQVVGPSIASGGGAATYDYLPKLPVELVLRVLQAGTVKSLYTLATVSKSTRKLVLSLANPALRHHVHCGELLWILPIPGLPGELVRVQEVVTRWCAGDVSMGDESRMCSPFDRHDFPFYQFVWTCLCRSFPMRNRRRLWGISKQFERIGHAAGIW